MALSGLLCAANWAFTVHGFLTLELGDVQAFLVSAPASET